MYSSLCITPISQLAYFRLVGACRHFKNCILLRPSNLVLIQSRDIFCGCERERKELLYFSVTWLSTMCYPQTIFRKWFKLWIFPTQQYLKQINLRTVSDQRSVKCSGYHQPVFQWNQCITYLWHKYLYVWVIIAHLLHNVFFLNISEVMSIFMSRGYC